MPQADETKMREVFRQNINRLFATSGKQKKDLAAAVGVSDNTVTAWVKGRKVPRMDKIDLIVAEAQRSERSPVLSEAELELVKKYRALDGRGRANVDALLERELSFVKAGGSQ